MGPPASSGTPKKPVVNMGPDWDAIWAKAKKRAFRGGIAGSSAMLIQVCSLMWMRTTMNYQYRNGTTTTRAFKHLFAEGSKDGGGTWGGVRRFYRGIGPGLLQGPLSRFGDTAANAGVLAVMDSIEQTRDLPAAVKTVAASLGAASWRICLMPIDCCKTSLQVEGKGALLKVATKVRTSGPQVLWHGSLAACSGTFVGHYPWFATYNTLQELIPKPKDDEAFKKLSRNAVIGFTSSVVSDTCSNSIRVVKTYKQTCTEVVSYPQAVKNVVAKDGWIGMFGRGLKTRILANGMQGLMFSVLWKQFEAMLNKDDP